jgi:hypothetical protein
VCDVFVVLALVELLPNRYKSITCWGVGRMNRGWFRVVGVSVCSFVVV